MSANVLSLPIDIPWKRLCVSEDMIDRNVCDRKFPYRWRSSVAVFSYQPPEDQQNYEGMIVSYLKVACTITGFQPDPNEVGIKNRRVDSYWKHSSVIENYKEIVNKYYGCYGAILEVAIAPAGRHEEISLSQYPYFIDFEPKKRELYELVTETGEIMSRTLENVNVHKGGTTTNSREVVDSTTISGEFKNLSLSPSGEGLSNAQVGLSNTGTTRNVNQEEYVNMRTTDQAREARETFSHSTQLTQMYHQFTSYHLGTNRAVFFMLPRPHIVQSESTFVNGPRLLEGIQEVFLVVMRPKAIEEICVEAYLETAHIASTPITQHDPSSGTLTLHLEKKAVEVDLDGADDTQDQPAETSEIYTPPEGWEVDLGRDGGYKIESVSGERITEAKVTAAPDHVTAYGKVTARFQDDTWPDPNEFFDARIDMVVTIYIRKKTPSVIGFQQNLWLTGRGVCCCPELSLRELFAPSVVFEKSFNRGTTYLVKSNGMTVNQANQLRSEIGQEIIHSINHPDRYERGTVGFTDTQFLARSMAQLIGMDEHPDNSPVTNIRGLAPETCEKIVQVAPKVSRARLLKMSSAEQMDRFQLTQREVRELRQALLGLVGPLPEPQRRWDRPGRAFDTSQTVPNVVGLLLEEAQQALRTAQFSPTDPVSYRDSELPRGVVLEQTPEAGTTVLLGSKVELVVASGAVVRVPDLVGKLLSQALVMLRDAGLQSEPEICFVSSEEYPRSQVIEVSPGMRSYITPYACVTLQVSSGSTNCETSD